MLEQQLSQDLQSPELPAAPQAEGVLHRAYRSARKLINSIMSHIDPTQFPGSCCG